MARKLEQHSFDSKPEDVFPACEWRIDCRYRARIRNAWTCGKTVCTDCYGHAVDRTRSLRAERGNAVSGDQAVSEAIEKIRAISRMQKPSPSDHWRKVLSMRNTPSLAEEAAENYFRRLGIPERQPGEDDE